MPHRANKTCCERQDATFYTHKCGCPSIQIITKSVEKTATLCGTVDPDDETEPPTYYKLKTETAAGFYIGEGDDVTTYEIDDEGNCTFSTVEGIRCSDLFEDGGKYYTTKIRTTGFEDSILVDEPCNLDPGPNYNPLGTYYDASYSDRDIVTSVVSIEDEECKTTNTTTYSGSSSISWSSTDCESEPPSVSSGSCQSDRDSGDGSWSGTIIDNGTSTPTTDACEFIGDDPETIDETDYEDEVEEVEGEVVYSDADDETSALDRAEEVESNSKSSIYETRTDSTFIQRTVNYCFLCTNLVPGLKYEAEIPVQSREAIAGGPADIFVAEDSDSFTINSATKKYHIEGGSLNAGISETEFIENNYSLEPTDYGLDSDDDVVIPETPLENTQGYEYVIGTNPDEDPTYIQKQ